MTSSLASQCKYRHKPHPVLYESAFMRIQEAIKESCAALYSSTSVSDGIDDERTKTLVMESIRAQIRANRVSFSEYTEDELVKQMYHDLTYSVLYEPLFMDDTVEKINCNGWDKIFVTFIDGSVCQIRGFISKEAALSVTRKLLDKSNGIDQSTPAKECQFGTNIRVSAVQFPLVDEEAMVSFSIRKLRHKEFSGQEYISKGFISEEGYEFLCNCMRYGVPVIVAGRVGTGKTMFIRLLLNMIKSTTNGNKRIITIEDGAREYFLAEKGSDGLEQCDVVHLLTRPSADGKQDDITPERLVKVALRFDGEVIVVSEMRDVEAYAAQEAANTGSVVISSIHAGGPSQVHDRIADLCRKKYPVDYRTALLKACRAFPVVVYLFQGYDRIRRCVNISQACVDGESISYNTLYSFNVDENIEHEDGSVEIRGKHEAVNAPTIDIVNTMIMHGAPRKVVTGLKGVSS